ncbi:MAG: TAXI family TRAP transporter solute-binding subunit [Clostridiales bacterium]
MRKIISFVMIITLIVTFASCDSKSDSKSKNTFVTIGTGGITGIYYPTGGAISQIINEKQDEYGIKCSVESTGGSVFNINAIMTGDLDFGVVQSDRQYQAINGLAEWEGKGKQEDIRSVFSIHPESVTLVAAVDAGINSIEDLKGKKVNIGNPGSGQRQNSIDALENFNIDYNKDIKAESVKAAEAPSLLQDGRIDAFFYTVGHPSGAFKEATSGKRKVKFIPIEGIDKLIDKYSYYSKSVIQKDMYPNAENTEDIPTFGVKATFVTSADVPDDVVYAITKEVFENLDEFKSLHEAFGLITKESMLEGLSAKIHPGAMKYYEEVGLK